MGTHKPLTEPAHRQQISTNHRSTPNPPPLNGFRKSRKGHLAGNLTTHNHHRESADASTITSAIPSITTTLTATEAGLARASTYPATPPTLRPELH